MLQHNAHLAGLEMSKSPKDELVPVPGAQAEVWPTLGAGTILTLASQINSVLEMWASILSLLGVGDFGIPRASIIDRHIPRAEAKPMPIELLQAEERSLNFQSREFDYAAGVSKPVDLTGGKLEFNVYRPRESATIHIKAGASTIDFSVPLTRLQAVAFMALPDDKEQAAYLGAIITSDQALQRQISAAVESARDASPNEDPASH